MGSQTTPLRYPYPTGGDRVMDGDNAIQALAEALNNDNAGATYALTLSGSLTGSATIYRRGSLAVINFNMTVAVALTNGQNLANIPAGVRPIEGTVFVHGYYAAGPYGPVPLHITSGGTFAVQTAAIVGAIIRGSAAWAVAPGTPLLRSADETEPEPRDTQMEGSSDD